MHSVLRIVIVYVLLLLIFRIAGKRSLAQITTFDFVLLLIISETVQNALVDNDYSITHALIAVSTLIALDIGLSVWKQRSRRVAKIVDDVPLVLVDDGKLLQERMDRERVDEDDIMQAAREQRGLERLDQVKYAVLEKSGGITVIARESAAS